MAKVKRAIFVVLILTQICCLLAIPVGEDKKGGPKKEPKGKEASAAASKESGSAPAETAKKGSTIVATGTAAVSTGLGYAMKSPFTPAPIKVGVAIGKVSWSAISKFRDGAGITEVAKASLESTIQSAADVYSTSGGKALQIGCDAIKDISKGKNVQAVLQESGKELVRQHVPGYEIAENAYGFIIEARNSDKDQIIGKLIDAGTEEAKKKLKKELTTRYGNQMDTFIDAAIDTAIEAKNGNGSAEQLAETFVKVGGEVICKKQEELFPDLKKPIDVAARVSELVEGGMSYQDAVKAEAVKAAKEHINDNELKKKIEAGSKEVNKILENANKLGLTNMVAYEVDPEQANESVPDSVDQYVKQKVKHICSHIPGSYSDCSSDSDAPSSSKKGKKNK